MNLTETYKDLYEFELSRKSDLTSGLGLPTGVVSLVVGGLVFMAKELHLPLGDLETAQLALMFLSGLAAMGAGVYLFKSLFNFTYGYLPAAGQLKNYKDKLTAYHSAVGGEATAQSLAEAETLQYLDDQYVVNADQNATNNQVKSAALHNAHFCMIVSVLFTAVAGMCFVYNSITSPRTVQRMELVNLKELKSNESPRTPGGNAAAASAADKAGTTPQPTDQRRSQPTPPAAAAASTPRVNVAR